MLHLILRAGIIAITVFGILTTSQAAEDKKVSSDPHVREALNLLEIWIKAQLDYERIPGISMAVVYDQELVWSKGFGFSNLEKKVAATPDTIYSICSISKLFTSIAIMQLRDAGKIRLDDPVSNYLPWFIIENTDPDAPPITVRSLLTHSSGLPAESDYPYRTDPEFAFPSRKEIIERLPQQKTLYPPDTYLQYSNLGLTLVGEIVAAASGQPYDEYVREHILLPLGLDDTTPYLPEDLLGARLALRYSRWPRSGGRERLPFFQANGITPAAGFASDATDLAQFASWQFRVLDRRCDDVLSSYTLKEMYRVHWIDPDWDTKWGLGFATWRSEDKTFVGHGGGCPGYRTFLLLSPTDKIAVVFMSNAWGVNTRMHAEQSYRIVAPAIAAALKPSEAKEPEPTDLEKYTGYYQIFWIETAVLVWNGSLAAISLPTDNPMESLVKLKHVGADVFRRIRDDGELGEEYIFELDEKGRVYRLKWLSNYLRKIR